MDVEQITWLGNKRKKTKQEPHGPKVLTTVRLPSSLYHEAKASGDMTGFITKALECQRRCSYLKTNYRREDVVDIMDQVASLYSTSWLTQKMHASMFSSMKASILNPRGEFIVSGP